MAALLSKRMGDYSHAAELYEILAEGLEKGENEIVESTKVILLKGLEGETTTIEPSAKSAASDYRKAAECWEQANNHGRAMKCWQNSRRLREQSELQVVIDIPEKLFLGEWDALNVTLSNNGFGSARNLSIKVEGPMTVHDIGKILEIAVGERKSAEIVLRPNEAGRRVPVTIRVTFQDAAGAQELQPITKFLTVARQEEATKKKAMRKRSGKANDTTSN